MNNLNLKQYRPDIDGLRAIAVLLVLIFHAFPKQLKGGFIGVDVFFVISGYLISRILIKEIASNTFSIYKFYQRRIKRIFPALLVVLILTAVSGWFLLLPNEFVSLAKHIAAGASFVSNFLLWHEAGYFDSSIAQKPLMHLWSLGVEEQFYIVWPLLLFFSASTQISRTKNMIVIIGLVSFGYSVFQLQVDGTGAFYSPISRFWELLLGAYLAKNELSSDEVYNLKLKKYLALIGIFLIIFSAFIIDSRKSFPGWLALLPTIGTALVIYADKNDWVSRKILSNPYLVFIGLVSYPLYLWHWVILAFFRIQDPNLSWQLRCVIIICSSLLSIATFYFVEQPIRKSKHKLLVPVLIALMLILLSISFAIFKFGFLTKSLTPLQQQLTKAYNSEEAYRYKTCFLNPDTQNANDFSSGCTQQKNSSKPVVLLWGDSLAAQLYSGLSTLQDNQNFFLAQRTAGSCPPGLASDISHHGSCDAINKSTREYIINNQPSTVVLSGRWTNSDRNIEVRINTVIDFLKQNSVKKIVLVGPNPDWTPDLKNILLRTSFPNDILPNNMLPPADGWKITQSLNKQLAIIAKNKQIVYLSPTEYLCKNNSCMIRVSNNIPDGLITSDHDHFTKEASIYLFNQAKVAAMFEYKEMQ